MPRTHSGRDVFINCPFDSRYSPIFNAIVFCVHDAGFRPRSALEADNAALNRLSRIMDIIAQCKYGIHDISRTQLNAARLPRFNMPLELGIFLGCNQYGRTKKSTLILDRDPYRYQQFISDIAGQDIHAHGNDVYRAIDVVRNWLRTESRDSSIPGGAYIRGRFDRFNLERAAICRNLNLHWSSLTYVDFSYVVATWLDANP